MHYISCSFPKGIEKPKDEIADKNSDIADDRLANLTVKQNKQLTSEKC